MSPPERGADPGGSPSPPSEATGGRASAAVGALAGAALILARGAIRDVPTALIAVVSLVCLVRFKVPEPALVAAAGTAGVLLRGG